MKKNDKVEIFGELISPLTLKIIIDNKEYYGIVDSNGEFEIAVDQEHFAQSLSKTDIILIAVAMGSIFGYSLYQIISFIADIRFSFVYFN